MEIQLGPFQLDAPLARGGMGVVWAGQHRREGLPVAVKVLREADPRLTAALETEVRAVAGLDHQNIIWVHDVGEVDAAAAHASRGALLEGTPWFAMERCDGGTAVEAMATLDWPALSSMLTSLLEALAHAHARGVVHRDLKPANILFGGERPGLKLSDFGMVLLRESSVDADDGPPITGGTPRWMAPEQFAGPWGDQGPWTDLYALGCVAFTMVNGQPPFLGSGLEALRAAHFTQPPPKLRPRFATPIGLEAWVHALLEKRPRDRIRHAADALAALTALGEPVVPAQSDARPSVHDDPTLPLSQQSTRLLSLPPPTHAPRPTSQTSAASAPPPPRDWRTPTARPPLQLVGAGLGLFGVRPLPLVGREDLCDTLWRRLREVHATRTPGAVVLQGLSGTGKSRLARWLGARAAEVGATAMWATHSPRGAPHDGLAGLVARELGLLGAAEDVISKRVSDLRLRAMVRAARSGGADPLRTEERLQAVLARVHSHTPHRAVVVVLDDVQWGSDALALARTLLDGSGPVLVVCTVQSEALAEEPERGVALDELLQQPSAAALELGPLPRHAWPALVDAVLPLQPALASTVAERVEGNPLFAVHLLGDWVVRGLLHTTPTGLALADGAEAPLPADLSVVWAARVERLLEANGAWRVPLELAAALGRDLPLAEWQAVCEHVGVEADPGLVRALVGQRLASARAMRQGRLAFSHGMLQEAIEVLAAAADRRADNHRACARTLASQPWSNGRVGLHLLAAGDDRAALLPLLEGIKDAFGFTDYAAMERLLRVREQALRRLHIGEDDILWADGWIERARRLYSMHDTDAALRWWGRCRELARRHRDDEGWQDVLATVLMDTSLAALGENRVGLAADRAEEAARLGELIGSGNLVANASYHLAAALTAAGKPQRGLERLRKAGAWFEQEGRVERLIDCLLEESLAHARLEQFGAAQERLEVARAHAETLGIGVLKARVQSLCGQLHLEEGDGDAALTGLRASWEHVSAYPASRWWTHVRLILILGLLHERRWQEAQAHVAGMKDRPLQPESTRMLQLAHLVLGTELVDVSDPAVAEPLRALAGREVMPRATTRLLRLAAERAPPDRRPLILALVDAR